MSVSWLLQPNWSGNIVACVGGAASAAVAADCGGTCWFTRDKQKELGWVGGKRKIKHDFLFSQQQHPDFQAAVLFFLSLSTIICLISLGWIWKTQMILKKTAQLAVLKSTSVGGKESQVVTQSSQIKFSFIIEELTPGRFAFTQALGLDNRTPNQSWSKSLHSNLQGGSSPAMWLLSLFSLPQPLFFYCLKA